VEGWVKLHRKITENELYFSERFTKMAAWIDLLILATHKAQTVYIRGAEIRLLPGELCYSIVSLAKRWKWNKRTVDKLLNTLENRQMIHSRKSNITTIITIQNWNEYQESALQSAQQSAQQRAHKQECKECTEAVVQNSNGFDAFMIVFKQKISEQEIPVLGNPSLRMLKPYQEYGEDAVKDALNKAIPKWKRNGPNGGDFLQYFTKIIKEDYPKLTERLA
jgi:DNA-binding transcriptional regulator YhcF (GntR family)